MNFICKPCKEAADTGKMVGHGKCPGGTWCDCQHHARRTK